MLRDWFVAYAQDRYSRTGYDIVRYGSRIASVTSCSWRSASSAT